PEYEIIEKSADAALSGDRDLLDFDLVIVDIGDGEMLADQRLAEYRRSLTDTPFITISEDLSAERMRKLVQLASTDWIPRPVDGRNLLEAVSEHLKGRRVGKNSIYTFMSCVGGAGGTMLALSAAARIAEKRKSRRTIETCLVDLDFSAAACGFYLDVYNEFNLDGFVTDPSRIDLELLDIIKHDLDPGFSLLSFRKPELLNHTKSEEFVLRLLDVAAYRYRNVVIDMPRYDTPFSETVLKGSDHIFLVTLLTIPAIKYARDAYLRLREVRGDGDNINLIINKNRTRLFSSGISRKEVEKVFKGREINFLPEDNKLMAEAINRGILPRVVNKRSALLKRFNTLLDDVLVTESDR
ncbi:MAG: pilus assembly protein, partial [Alphaproteobacteria bacterium]|nr:pilus assembly protein [Alphaproteobacteria bacterium]